MQEERFSICYDMGWGECGQLYDHLTKEQAWIKMAEKVYLKFDLTIEQAREMIDWERANEKDGYPTCYVSFEGDDPGEGVDWLDS